MKSVARFMLVAFFGAFLLSVACLALESDHDCEGDDCPICAVLLRCGEVLKTAGTGVEPCQWAPRLFALHGAEEFCAYVGDVSLTTLVTQKVRLDN